MEILISVIVPIYNAERYLDECITSITGQSYRKLQIILVNDGSTDASQKIAETYASADSRILLINQLNSGVAAARQEGLDKATGKYIIHCDSDDFFTSQAIEQLFNAAEADGADITVGDFIRKKDEEDTYFSHYPVDAPGFLKGILTSEFHGGLWNKLIKKELYEGFRFQVGVDYLEDKLAVVTMLVKKELKIAFVASAVYVYRYVSDSYTNSMSERSVISGHISDGIIISMVSDIYDVKFIAHLKNKRRITSLLNSNLSQRGYYPDADSFLLGDKRLKYHHRILLLLDIKGGHKLVLLYRILNSARRKLMLLGKS